MRYLAELRHVKVRFAFDHVNHESAVADAISLCRSHGLKDFGVYVLIGYRDTPEDALYRLEKAREWRAIPNPMRYQPLDALGKNEYVAPGWTERKLKDTARYYSQLIHFGHFPFGDYRRLDMPLFEVTR